MSSAEEYSKLADAATSTMDIGWRRCDSISVLKFSGTDRIDFLHRLTTNNIQGLKPNSGVITTLLNVKGRLIDVLTVLEGDQFAYVLCNATKCDDVVKWFKTYIIMDDVKISKPAEVVVGLEIFGNSAPSAVSSLFESPVIDLPMSSWVESTVNGEQVVIVRVPSIFDVSYQIIASPKTIESIADTLLESDTAIPLISGEAYEHQRILMGFPVSPNELNDNYNPLESGLLHYISFTKGCYIGQEVIARLDSYNKVQRHLVGISSENTVRACSKIFFEDKEVGLVTSTSDEMHNNRHIALAYVRSEYSVDGAKVKIADSDSNTESFVDALVHQLPFAN